ncbi:MAG TPA: YidB family protein [Terriglobales bacterium]|jgi:uncharacterized protein YidB (DUF937 family)|nr:YidB family protein [Terriglobales bacterium]
MGFLEDMASKAVASAGGGSNPMVSAVLQMIQNQPGGVSGLLQQFHEKGLGDLVNSWVGTGQNQQISPDQVQHVLGTEQVQQVAEQAGISPDAAKSKLAEFLPMILDKLTPNGQVPAQGSLLESGMSLLKSFEGN